MNTFARTIRSSLIALGGALILGTAATAQPIAVLGTITVRPDAATLAAVHAIPTLPTVRVVASEEEILAARLDPSDGIRIFSTIAVQPSAGEVAAAKQAAAAARSGEDEDEDGGFIGALVRAATGPHRLRLDMPYYSLGKRASE